MNQPSADRSLLPLNSYLLSKSKSLAIIDRHAAAGTHKNLLCENIVTKKSFQDYSRNDFYIIYDKCACYKNKLLDLVSASVSTTIVSTAATAVAITTVSTTASVSTATAVSTAATATVSTTIEASAFSFWFWF